MSTHLIGLIAICFGVFICAMSHRIADAMRVTRQRKDQYRD